MEESLVVENIANNHQWNSWLIFSYKLFSYFENFSLDGDGSIPRKPTCDEDTFTFKDELERVKQEIKSKTPSETATVVKERNWARLESARAHEDFFSYHGDIDACEDTERVVLFDDFSFVLFSLDCQEGVFQILLSYLLLLGMAIPRSRYSKSLLKISSKLIKVTEVSEPCFCHSPDFSCDFVQIADSALFSDNCCSGSFYRQRILVLRKILYHAMEIFHEDSIIQCLSVVWLHMESTLFRSSFENVKIEFNKKYWKEMRKFLKSLLKMPCNRNCVLLWNMYATYEWQIGNDADAEKTFSLVLRMSPPSKHENREEFPGASTLRLVFLSYLFICFLTFI